MIRSKAQARTQQARSAETRAAILAAAADAFAESGLAGARTDAIAAAAGVNKAMLYYHFKSKSRLYEAVIESHFEEFNRQALQVLDAPGPARAVLLRYASLHFDFITAKQRCARIYQQMMLTGGRPLERLVRKYFLPRSVALDRVLERGMKAGEFRRADRRHTAISIIALIVFYFSASQVLHFLGHSDAYDRANLKARKREVLDFIRHGLFIDSDISLT
jgi:TetR/AcrR family transcriptional regulator